MMKYFDPVLYLYTLTICIDADLFTNPHGVPFFFFFFVSQAGAPAAQAHDEVHRSREAGLPGRPQAGRRGPAA